MRTLLPLIVFTAVACNRPEAHPVDAAADRSTPEMDATVPTFDDGSTDAGVPPHLDAGRESDAGQQDVEADAGHLAEPPGCDDDETLCGDVCVDTQQDPSHCGECDRRCGGGEVCVLGGCQRVEDCREMACSGLSYCDLSTGVCHPGCAFDEQCGDNERCNTSTHECVCMEQHHRCGGTCSSNLSVLTCGTGCSPCGTDPHGDPRCDGTSCGLTCDAGYQECGDTCATCPNDPGAHHFGCGEDNACVVESCRAGHELCAGGCAMCPDDPHAERFGCDESGQCVVTSCDEGYHLCGDGRCYADDDIRACGADCNVCDDRGTGGSPVCQGGTCGVLIETNTRDTCGAICRDAHGLTCAEYQWSTWTTSCYRGGTCAYFRDTAGNWDRVDYACDENVPFNHRRYYSGSMSWVEMTFRSLRCYCQ